MRGPAIVFAAIDVVPQLAASRDAPAGPKNFQSSRRKKPGGESHTFNMFPDLGRIECPTLVMGGKTIEFIPSRAKRISRRHPPHLVQFKRFPNCGHAVIPDAPDRAMAVIRDFIQR